MTMLVIAYITGPWMGGITKCNIYVTAAIALKLLTPVLVSNDALPCMRVLKAVLARLIYGWDVRACSLDDQRRIRTISECLLDLVPAGHHEWTILEDCLV